jgi:hypothetical protein
MPWESEYGYGRKTGFAAAGPEHERSGWGDYPSRPHSALIPNSLMSGHRF